MQIFVFKQIIFFPYSKIFTSTLGHARDIIQGKLIAVVNTLRTYWNQFSLGGIWTRMKRCISFRLVSEEVKNIKFDNFDNSHNSFLWPEYFIDFFMWKMDPMSGCNIRLVFTFPPRDSTLQYKRCVHLWDNFPCITSSYVCSKQKFPRKIFNPIFLIILNSKIKNMCL